MSRAFHLAQLQKIDTQLDQLRIRQGEIERVLSSNDAMMKVEAEHKDATELMAKAQRNLHASEDAVQAQQIKLETSEAALYAGKIRNPKELQDLQVDIQSLKKHLSTLEDQQLEAMMELERVESLLKSSVENLSRVQAETASQSAGLLGEHGQLIRTQERLLTERQAVLPQLLPEDLAVYQRLREQKKGLAVSLVEDNACKGCGTALRPAEIQAARSSSQLARCSTCGRILYAG